MTCCIPVNFHGIGKEAPPGTLVLSHGFLQYSASGLHFGRLFLCRRVAWRPALEATLLNADNSILTTHSSSAIGYALQLCNGPNQAMFRQGRKIGDSSFPDELPGSPPAAEQFPEIVVVVDIVKT
jgi:hypothetical protein